MSDTTTVMPMIPATAPAAVEYPYGLFSVAPAVGLPDGWEGGVGWPSYACGQVGFSTMPCASDTPDPVPPLLENVACGTGVALPFAVYSYGRLSTLGASRGADLSTRRAAARAALLAGEQVAAEQGLWDRFVDASADVDNPAPDIGVAFDGSAKQTIRNAIAILEAAFVRVYGATPTLHIPRYGASLVGDEMVTRSNVMTTPLGSQVVAGGGYGPPIVDDPAEIDIYITGPVVLARGEVLDSPAFDTAINSISGLAQRLYVAGWDCGIMSATVPLVAPGG